MTDASLLPDLAPCPDCLAEVREPSQRRHGYPFTTCAACGPRFTIATGRPYDRERSTMAPLLLCSACAGEYADPRDRRFHAPAIACPVCGPRVWLEAEGPRLEGAEALEGAARLIERGGVLALKGVGGFLLLCDATSSKAVARLRERKSDEGPFPVMFPTLGAVVEACEVREPEADWLRSAAAPAVLLARRLAPARPEASLADEVAPGGLRLAAMLPSSVLDHLLLSRLGTAVVAARGSLGEEPVATVNEDARRRLALVADGFLMHDRPIARPAEESILRLSRGRQAVRRRARGLAPLPVAVSPTLAPVLALGARRESTVTIAFGRQLVTSPPLGRLETPEGFKAFETAIADLRRLYGFDPALAAADLDGACPAARHAATLGLEVARVQHQHAHVAACMAEHGVEAPALGVAFDAPALGPDDSLWGGELLRVDEGGATRLGWLRPFILPGGDAAAAREPRRAALGLLVEGRFDASRLESRFEPAAWASARLVSGSAAASPRASSVSRLIDAAASLAGLVQVEAFPGQAALALGGAAEAFGPADAYAFALELGKPVVMDWAPVAAAMLEDAAGGAPAGLIAARLLNGLAAAVAEAAARCGLERVVLAGEAFQLACLAERCAEALEKWGFQVFLPQQVPGGDAGVSAGQAFLAGAGWGLNVVPAT